MTDIVERLREESLEESYGSDLAIVPKEWLNEAADEIERLRGLLDAKITGDAEFRRTLRRALNEASSIARDNSDAS